MDSLGHFLSISIFLMPLENFFWLLAFSQVLYLSDRTKQNDYNATCQILLKNRIKDKRFSYPFAENNKDKVNIDLT